MSEKAKGEMSECHECGMLCKPYEYHPYAACLMYKACHNSATVRENLKAVIKDATTKTSD